MPSSIIFVVGRCNDEAEYTHLMDAVGRFYRGHLIGTPFHVTRWDADVLKFIEQKVPSGDGLILVGFSFGGGRAVQVCGQLQRPVKKLVLIDPVNPVWWGPQARPKGPDGKALPLPWSGPWSGNTWDFTVPNTVQSAHCFYREAHEMPWSAPIRNVNAPPSGRCDVTNVRYVPTKPQIAEAHGEYVWRAETVAVLKGAL